MTEATTTAAVMTTAAATTAATVGEIEFCMKYILCCCEKPVYVCAELFLISLLNNYHYYV